MWGVCSCRSREWLSAWVRSPQLYWRKLSRRRRSNARVWSTSLGLKALAKNGRRKAMWAAKVFRNSASPFAVNEIFVQRRSPFIASRRIRPLATRRSRTPVSVPLVTSVWAESSEQVMPSVSPSVAMTSNCEGVSCNDLIWRMSMRQKARYASTSGRNTFR